MEEPYDEIMEEVEVELPPETLPLSDDEQRVLELYSKLQQLQLEIAIINAQYRHDIHPTTNADSPEETERAQQALLDARAQYAVLNDMAEFVMMANPIIKAVHDGKDKTPIERDLLPYIERRDNGAITAAQVHQETWDLRSDLTQVQSDTIQACRRNMKLTAELFTLAEELKEKRAIHAKSKTTIAELQTLEDELKHSKQRWRAMKGVASGIVAESGVDWVSNDELRYVVLEPEDED
ncbi:hypothetical protein VHEMI02690 [[Torrubiella] hemipterigena]|uniref:Centromere protein H C-terminal domain-containing protein n=1 Tax=[Torrubiella] hemipterigena TaxID=1531966 RepID=A0A0A1T927_9HYPO|nr:hypothetical protein VHEMI02690 [[Torrubiella] hemipterigena]